MHKCWKIEFRTVLTGKSFCACIFFAYRKRELCSACVSAPNPISRIKSRNFTFFGRKWKTLCHIGKQKREVYAHQNSLNLRRQQTMAIDLIMWLSLCFCVIYMSSSTTREIFHCCNTPNFLTLQTSFLLWNWYFYF